MQVDEFWNLLRLKKMREEEAKEKEEDNEDSRLQELPTDLPA